MPIISLHQLADLAEVSAPDSPTSPGAQYLLAVAREIAADLAEVGPGLHAASVPLIADLAVPLDDAEAFAAFVDLALWDEGLPTTEALEAAGRRLGAALVAAAGAAPTSP